MTTDASDVIKLMNDTGVYKIDHCSENIDLENEVRYKKLSSSSEQKAHISLFAQQIPSMLAVNAMSQAYVLSFPEGLPKALTALKQGGFGSMIQGSNGQFVGTASFLPMSAQAAIFGAFTAMSVVSGQYFLSQINSKLNMINLNLDKILEFLYGDKKSELLSEISFVKYAYQNFNSIMEHEQQTIATITSIQEAKKVAMKDIEFFTVDLDSTANTKNDSNLISVIDKALQIKESFELSLQLYVMSNLLEVYYAQNFDPDYLCYIETDSAIYIDKCEKRMLSSFSVLNRRINDYKSKIWEKLDKSVYEKQISEIIALLNSGEESKLRKTMIDALWVSDKKTEYYLNKNGSVYLKV